MSYTSMNDALTEDNYTCRICLEDDQSHGLIYPCKCTGTSKYVHKKCLNEWRMITNNKDNQYKCEICNYRYVIIPSRDNQNCFIKTVFSTNCVYFCMNILALMFYFVFKFIDPRHKIAQAFVPDLVNLNEEDINIVYLIFSLGVSIALLGLYILSGMLTIRNPKLYCKLYYENTKMLSIFLCLITTNIIIKFYNVAIILIEYLIYNVSILHLQSVMKVRVSNNNEINNYDENDVSSDNSMAVLDICIDDNDSSEFVEL